MGGVAMALTAGGYGDVCAPCAAGSFYPGSQERLAALVRQLVETNPERAAGSEVAGLVVPHAGYVYSGKTAGRAYACAAGRQVTRVVVLGPAHHGGFRGLAVGGFEAFRTPLGEMPVDLAVCRGLCTGEALLASRREAFRDEHAVEVQLPFLQTVCPGAVLVPLLCGDLGPQEVPALARALARGVPQEGTLWVVSSDFTHYGEAFGYVPFTRDVLARVEQLDRGVIEAILRQDPEGLQEVLRATGATVCGADAIGVLLAVLKESGETLTARLLEYTQSGRMEHDETHSVGYAAIVFCRAGEAGVEGGWRGPSPAAGQHLVRLAREALAAGVRGEEPVPPDPEGLPAELLAPGATFVSLHCAGMLRGCMGSLEARQPLYVDVLGNALNAGFRDPRFGPLGADELGATEVEVTVLSPLRPIADAAQFQVGRHGILLRRGAQGAVYLPQVAVEHGWDRETTLDRLCGKAGLPAGAWRHGARLQVFEAQVFKESAEGREGAGTGR